MIQWKPISEMPDELRDGRQVLFATRYDKQLLALRWCRMRSRWELPTWIDDDGFRETKLTHYAELPTPPENPQ